mgnify:CR=1 FL=1
MRVRDVKGCKVKAHYLILFLLVLSGCVSNNASGPAGDLPSTWQGANDTTLKQLESCAVLTASVTQAGDKGAVSVGDFSASEEQLRSWLISTMHSVNFTLVDTPHSAAVEIALEKTYFQSLHGKYITHVVLTANPYHTRTGWQDDRQFKGQHVFESAGTGSDVMRPSLQTAMQRALMRIKAAYQKQCLAGGPTT